MLVRFVAVTALAVGLAGCATVRPEAALDDLRETVEARSDARVVWRTGAAEDARADSAVARLLAGPLTAEAAVQVALLNNRRLQATYEDLGVAQAELVQAGLLANPLFGGRALWALDEGGAPDLGFNVAFEFLDVFYLPLRKSVARSAYEAARLRVASAVLRMAADARTAYVRAQTDAARLAMQRRVVENAGGAYEAALVLREAGNVPAVDFLAEQALYEQARLDLVTAEVQAVESREALARRMGVFGPQARFRLDEEVPPVPATETFAARTGAGLVAVLVSGGTVETADALAAPALDLPALERAAVEASLDLAAARQDVLTYARRLGIARPQSVLPDLEVGGELEREEGHWKLGPEVEVVLPLFDQGQARVARARAELRRRQALYFATGVEVRSAARTLGQRLAAVRRTSLHYQRVVLPLRIELTAQTLLQYNAMQAGVFRLLQVQQMEIEAGRRYLDTLAAYWQARTDLDLLLQGVMPELGGGAALPESGGPAMADPGH